MLFYWQLYVQDEFTFMSDYQSIFNIPVILCYRHFIINKFVYISEIMLRITKYQIISY